MINRAPQPGELGQHLLRVIDHPLRQQLVDARLYLRRRRYGASHGVGLLHRLPGLEGTYAVALTAPDSSYSSCWTQPRQNETPASTNQRSHRPPRRAAPWLLLWAAGKLKQQSRRRCWCGDKAAAVTSRFGLRSRSGSRYWQTRVRGPLARQGAHVPMWSPASGEPRCASASRSQQQRSLPGSSSNFGGGRDGLMARGSAFGDLLTSLRSGSDAGLMRPSAALTR